STTRPAVKRLLMTLPEVQPPERLHERPVPRPQRRVLRRRRRSELLQQLPLRTVVGIRVLQSPVGIPVPQAVNPTARSPPSRHSRSPPIPARPPPPAPSSSAPCPPAASLHTAYTAASARRPASPAG